MKKRLSRLMSSFHGSCKSKEEMSSSAVPPIFYISPARRRMAAGAPVVVVEQTGGSCRSCVPQAQERRSSPAMDADVDMSRARETPAYLWRKDEKWHVVLCSEQDHLDRTMLEQEEAPSSTITELTDTSVSGERVLQLRKRERKNLMRLRSRISTSSSHDTTSCCCFSSDDDDEANDAEREDYYVDEDEELYEFDETNTLLSSLSFTDSDTVVRPRCPPSPEPRPATAVGMLRRLAVPCGGGTDEGKVAVQESFAVVKKSEDPRGDFQRSMAEMVAEKRIYDAADLEQLLHCFLSLNSRHHHRAIVSAFSDIWQTLFPDTSPPNFSYKQ